MSVEFIDLYKKVMHNTLLTPDRLWYLWLLPRLLSEAGIRGEHAELGTYRGGSARMIYDSCHGHTPLHVFDTFTGVPGSEITECDYRTKHTAFGDDLPKGMMAAGEFSAGLREVAQFLKNDKDNIFIYPGVFPETFDLVKDIQFSFVYLDMDLAKPTASALRLFWDILVPGGLIVCDDYKHIQGPTIAVEDFAKEKGLEVYNTAFMQCLIRKPLPVNNTGWDPNNLLWQFGG